MVTVMVLIMISMSDSSKLIRKYKIKALKNKARHSNETQTLTVGVHHSTLQ